MADPTSADLACVAFVAGCADCERRAKVRGCDGHCDDLCRSIAELNASMDGHAAFHAAESCRCGARRYGEGGESVEVARLCRYGRCVNWHCPNCDEWSGGYGPVNCRCNSSWWMRLLLRGWSWRDRQRDGHHVG